MRYAVSSSTDYNNGAVVIRDFMSVPKGRVLCFIPRDNEEEAKEIAQYMCDLLNKEEAKDALGTV